VPESQSPFVQGLQAAAKQHGVAVHVGIHVPVAAVDDTAAPTTVTKLLNRTVSTLPACKACLEGFIPKPVKKLERTPGENFRPPFSLLRPSSDRSASPPISERIID